MGEFAFAKDQERRPPENPPKLAIALASYRIEDPQIQKIGGHIGKDRKIGEKLAKTRKFLFFAYLSSYCLNFGFPNFL